MLILEDKRFYVYIYLDPRKLGKYVYGEYEFEAEPFYVGMGHGDRKLAHLYFAHELNEKSYKSNKIRKIKRETNKDAVIVSKNNLTRKDAANEEIKMIATIGRKDLNLGPLLNLTNGGDGSVGVVITDKIRKNWSKAQKRIWQNPERREKSRLSWLDPKRLEKFHKTINTEQFKIEDSERKKNLWKNEEYINKIKTTREKTSNDPIRSKEISKMISDGMLKKWQDPVYRQTHFKAQSEAEKRKWKENVNNIREKFSKRVTELNSKTWRITHKETGKQETIKNLNLWCEKNNVKRKSLFSYENKKKYKVEITQESRRSDNSSWYKDPKNKERFSNLQKQAWQNPNRKKRRYYNNGNSRSKTPKLWKITNLNGNIETILNLKDWCKKNKFSYSGTQRFRNTENLFKGLYKIQECKTEARFSS
jgi:hypothetical protein